MFLPRGGRIKTTFTTVFFMSILNGSLLNSQTLIPLAESAFDKQLPFNTSYIKTNNIKAITFDIMDKKDFETVEDKGLLNYYEFNGSGFLTRFYYTNIAKIIQKEYFSKPVYHHRKKISSGQSYTKNEYLFDTISTTYFYTPSNLLKLKRYNDGSFYESYYYDYNTDGKVISEKRFKETNVSETKTDFKLGMQHLISEESYEYKVISPIQYKKICLNDEGRIYKEVIYNKNDSNQLVNYNEQYTVAWINQQSNYTYNAKGQLTSAIYKSNSNGDFEQKRTFEYDTNDCLLTEKQYKNNVLEKEVSYITDSSKKLTSYIIRDSANKSLRIVKLIYTYWY